MPKVLVATRGAELLSVFLRAHKITYTAAAEALGVAITTICAWIDCTKRPEDLSRRMIAKWTNGFVPADSWLAQGEIERIGHLAPFVAAPMEQSTRMVA